MSTILAQQPTTPKYGNPWRAMSGGRNPVSIGRALCIDNLSSFCSTRSDKTKKIAASTPNAKNHAASEFLNNGCTSDIQGRSGLRTITKSVVDKNTKISDSALTEFPNRILIRVKSHMSKKGIITTTRTTLMFETSNAMDENHVTPPLSGHPLSGASEGVSFFLSETIVLALKKNQRSLAYFRRRGVNPNFP